MLSLGYTDNKKKSLLVYLKIKCRWVAGILSGNSTPGNWSVVILHRTFLAQKLQTRKRSCFRLGKGWVWPELEHLINVMCAGLAQLGAQGSLIASIGKNCPVQQLLCTWGLRPWLFLPSYCVTSPGAVTWSCVGDINWIFFLNECRYS